MNKEEILAKSRAENKGTDEREKLVLAKAGQKAFGAGLIVCMLITMFNGILSDIDKSLYDPKLTCGPWGIYLSMMGTLFLYKYVKLRKKHELVLSIFFLIVGLAALVVLALEMTGVL